MLAELRRVAKDGVYRVRFQQWVVTTGSLPGADWRRVSSNGAAGMVPAASSVERRAEKRLFGKSSYLLAVVFGVSFSLGGDRLVSTSGDNTLLIWAIDR